MSTQDQNSQSQQLDAASADSKTATDKLLSDNIEMSSELAAGIDEAKAQYTEASTDEDINNNEQDANELIENLSHFDEEGNSDVNAQLAENGAQKLSAELGKPESKEHINQTGLNLVKYFEGFEAKAYQDSGGVWTIGYGHTSMAGPPKVNPGDTITKAQGEAILNHDIEKYESAVRQLVKVPLNSNQFSALVSFTYNMGPGNLAKSTLLKLLNSKDYAGAADAFLKWVYAAGKKLPGLVRRRQAERALFLKKVNPTPAQEQVTPTATQQDAIPSHEQGEDISTPTQEDATPSDDTPTVSDETATRELSANEAAIEQLVNEDIIEEVHLSEVELKSAPSNFRQQALKQAISQVGYKEEPSNCNKFSRYFGKDCHPWCADFVSWAFDSTGNRNKRVDWGNPSLVASILHWAQTKPDQALLVKTPEPGDIFLIQTSTASHTGLVRSVSGATFTTVEGNCSNSVRSVKRSLNKYVFVRVLRSQ